MYSFQTHGPCLDCNSAKAALALVDKKLDVLAKKHYAHITHLSSSKLCTDQIRDLIHYKTILSKLVFNPHYYETNVADIISKVKTIAL